MLEAAAILARLDAIVAELLELRAVVVASMPSTEGNGLDTESDFAPQNLIEISTAVDRFNRPADSLRWLCRKEACGLKVQGRWMASVPRLRRRLNRE